MPRIDQTRLLKIIIAFIVAVFLAILFNQCEENKILKNKVSQKEILTDTVYVDKIKLIEVKVITPPVIIRIQSKPDTITRIKVEKETIVLGSSVFRGDLVVQTIDTSGRIAEAVHKVLPTDKITMDNKGQVQIEPDKKAERKAKRKKVINKVSKVVIALFCFWLGSKI